MAMKIDHVVIAGDDLARLVAAFSAIGLVPDAGGVHADGQTHNALIGFPDGSYLELIAPVPGGDAASHPWGAFMRHNAGTCAWAIRSENIEADAEYFRLRGVLVGAPKPGGRLRPDGVRLEWRTCNMEVPELMINEPPTPLGRLLPFLIQDVTPRALRVPVTASAMGIGGVAEVLIDAPTLPQWASTVFERDLNVPLVLQREEPPEAARLEHTPNGVYGVLLTIQDSDAAQKRYGWPDSDHRFWRDQATFWPPVEGALLGFVGEMG